MKLTEDQHVKSLIQDLKLGVISERYNPENFGDAELQLSHESAVRIQIVRDRGQVAIFIGDSEVRLSLNEFEAFLHPKDSPKESSPDEMYALLRKNFSSYLAVFNQHRVDLLRFVHDREKARIDTFNKTSKLQ